MAEGMTVITVAHRFSTIKNSNVIVIVDEVPGTGGGGLTITPPVPTFTRTLFPNNVSLPLNSSTR